MAFVDEMKFIAAAGQGGDGVVRWRQEKFIPKGGPAGGDGGRGGDFYVQAVRDIHILSKYKAQKEFKASRGGDGGGKSLHGKAGADFILKLPVGSVVSNLDTEERWELEVGEKIKLLQGGHGGFGNEHFKSSTNTTPKECRPGKDGERGNFHIELELFADIGLIGLPNAGKTSLLNAFTNAEAKVGDYEFTTLDPNLGDFYGFIVADLPGLIEGAAEGKGLGIKFLRHIKRTKTLAHLISFDPAPEQARYGAGKANMMTRYKQVRRELKNYGQGLDGKKEIIILTKSDVADKKTIEKKVKEFKKLAPASRGGVFTLTLYDDKSVKKLKDALVKILRKL